MSSSKLYDSLSGILRIQQTLGSRLNWGKNPFLQATAQTSELDAFAVSGNLDKVVLYTGNDSGNYKRYAGNH